MNTRALVLAIDDVAENLELLDDYLCAKYEVQFALCGLEGLELARTNQPDLILLDVMMPGMDGYEVCNLLKSEPLTQNIPVIFVTAKEDRDSESRALAAGAVDFLHKPLNGDVVRARVQIHLDLKARERELRELNAQLEQHIRERTDELRLALFRAEASNRAKKQFLANINHELRTPMNGIMGLSELVARKIDDPLVRNRVDKIGRVIQQLMGVIDDIIDMADLQADKITNETLDFELQTLMDKATAVWRQAASSKGLTLKWHLDPDLPLLLSGDPKRLLQILDKLVGNAIKFSKQGLIELRALLVESRDDVILVRFEVEDQGIGIDPERQAAIFYPFEQADNSNTRCYEGAGLGLAICKQLSELMGGSIDVISRPGQGSRFLFKIPLGLGKGIPLAASADPDGGQQRDMDWAHARQSILALSALLANGEDIQAYLVWAKEESLLKDAMGPWAGCLKKAMDNFQFPEALECLTTAQAHCPQLATFCESQQGKEL